MIGLNMKTKENKTCECGCGQIPKVERKFIHGHNNREY